MGSFALEANAKDANSQLKSAGIKADMRPNPLGGKTLWVVSEKVSASSVTLAKVRQLGIPDAYIVTN